MEDELINWEAVFKDVGEKCRQEAFAHGASVTAVEDNAIYKFNPDGTKEFVKKIAPKVKIAQKVYKIKNFAKYER
ncbi:MAG: hypothetical protein R3Y43_06485 [Alphaproteobacteria bacterium]